MWKIVLLVFISLSGCQASLGGCSAKRCESVAPLIDVHNPDHIFPSVEMLNAVCPAVHATFDCLLEEFETCTNHDIEELSISDNETLAGVVEVILGTKFLMKDLCDPASSLHQAYGRSISCIKDSVMAPMAGPRCAFEAKALYGAYKIGEEDDEREKACMMAAYSLACVSENVLENCGEEARATLVELVKRTKFLKHGICTPQSIVDLKTKYLDYLALESSRRSIFEKVFNMRKRK